MLFHRLKKKTLTTRRIGNGTLSFAVIVILPFLPLIGERRSGLFQRDTGQPHKIVRRKNFAGFAQRAPVSVWMIISIEPYNK